MIKKILLISILLFSIHFWGLALLPNAFHNLTNVVSLLAMGYCFLKFINNKSLQFKNAIILFLIGIIINIISAYINNGQLPLHTFLAFGHYYFILFYFLLHWLKASRKELEHIIFIFAILFSLIYISQVLIYPQEIFRSQSLPSRGTTVRLIMEGNGFLVLAYFLMLNRFILHRRLISIVFALAFFTVLLMGGFRTMIAVTVLLSGVMIFKSSRFNVRQFGIFIFIVICFYGLFQIPRTSAILKEMIFASEEHLAAGDSYIRFLELDFFLNKYPVNKSVYIFGSGLHYGDKSSYSRYYEVLTQNGFFWEDLGLIGFYIINGVFVLLGILWYTLKVIFVKLPSDMFYVKFYFIFLLAVSFTTMEIFRIGIFAVQAIGLYLVDLSILDTKLLEESTTLDQFPDNDDWVY